MCTLCVWHMSDAGNHRENVYVVTSKGLVHRRSPEAFKSITCVHFHPLKCSECHINRHLIKTLENFSFITYDEKQTELWSTPSAVGWKAPRGVHGRARDGARG